MAEIDRHGSDIDQTVDDIQPGKYIPLEKVDRLKYDIIHPENALTRLNMSARTAYRKMDNGELPYTLERGSKRLLVRKDQTSSNPLVNLSVISPSLTDSMSENSQPNVIMDKMFDKLPDLQQMLIERDEEVRNLNSAITRLNEVHRTEIEQIRNHYQAQLEALRERLEAERIKNARMEGEITRIDTVQELVDTQKETINSQKTTIEALNNERIVITQQLQKYRTPEDLYQQTQQESLKPHWWNFWKK